MTPKLLGLATAFAPVVAGAQTSAGLPYCAWLNTLKASARKASPARSVSGKRLLREGSICQWPGPRAALRPRLPHVPLAGVENAAKFNQLEADRLAGEIG